MEKSCCVIGHRTIDKLNMRELQYTFKHLIDKEKVGKFNFGSNSKFNDVCFNVITRAKRIYSHLQLRCYVCENEIAFTKDNLNDLKFYCENFHISQKSIKIFDEVVLPKKAPVSSRARYVERNKQMIDESDFCIFYYDKNYITPTGTKSGTEIAYEYALKTKPKDKIIIIH